MLTVSRKKYRKKLGPEDPSKLSPFASADSDAANSDSAADNFDSDAANYDSGAVVTPLASFVEVSATPLAALPAVTTNLPGLDTKRAATITAAFVAGIVLIASAVNSTLIYDDVYLVKIFS